MVYEVIFFVSVICVPFLAVYWLIQYKCPNCKKIRALKYTGNKRTDRWVPHQFGAAGSYEADYERQCKYCGYRDWEPESDD